VSRASRDCAKRAYLSGSRWLCPHRIEIPINDNNCAGRGHIKSVLSPEPVCGIARDRPTRSANEVWELGPKHAGNEDGQCHTDAHRESVNDEIAKPRMAARHEDLDDLNYSRK